MPFNFEKFTHVDTSYSARVTIRQTGQIGFNGGAINRFFRPDQTHCVLYFDPIERVVGIELVSGLCDGAIEIKRGDTNTYIRSKNFCDRYGIDYRKPHRFALQLDQETGFLYFKLVDELAKETDGE